MSFSTTEHRSDTGCRVGTGRMTITNEYEAGAAGNRPLTKPTDKESRMATRIVPASPIDAPPHTTTLDEPPCPSGEPVRLGALLPGVLAQIRKNQEKP